MKKIAILIMMIFLVSMFAVAADNNTNDNTTSGQDDAYENNQHDDDASINQVNEEDDLSDDDASINQVNEEDDLSDDDTEEGKIEEEIENEYSENFNEQMTLQQRNRFVTECKKVIKQKNTKWEDMIIDKKCREAFNPQKREGILERQDMAKNKERMPEWKKEFNPADRTILGRFRTEQIQRLKNIGEEKVKELSMLPASQVKRMMAKSGSDEEFQNQINNMKTKMVKVKNLIQKRQITTEKYNQAVTKYKQAKEDFKESKGILTEKQDSFKQLREQENNCEKDDSTECDEIRQQTIEAAKEYAVTLANTMIDSLENIKYRVEQDEKLTEEETTEATTKIDERIAELESAIVATQASTTKEEVKAASALIKNNWNRARTQAAQFAGKVVEGNIHAIIVRSEHMEQKLAQLESAMAEKEMSSDSISEGITTFSDHVAQAKEYMEQTKTSSDTQATNGLFKQAHEELKEANSVLTEIFNEAKGLLKTEANKYFETKDDEEMVVVETA